MDEIVIDNVTVKESTIGTIVNMKARRVCDDTVFSIPFTRRSPFFNDMVLALFYYHEIESFGLLTEDIDAATIGLLAFDRTFYGELGSGYEVILGQRIRVNRIKKWQVKK